MPKRAVISVRACATSPHWALPSPGRTRGRRGGAARSARPAERWCPGEALPRGTTTSMASLRRERDAIDRFVALEKLAALQSWRGARAPMG